MMLDRGEYGQFFPVTCSTAYVPENGAVIWCGATAEQLKQIGGNAFDPNAEGATAKTTFDPALIRSVSDIPESIDTLGDDWAGIPIYDVDAKRSFSFLKQEIAHYRALCIAPPNQHFIPRFIDEVAKVGQAAAFENRTCDNCDTPIVVSECNRYPERRIYCKNCYLQYLEKNG